MKNPFGGLRPADTLNLSFLFFLAALSGAFGFKTDGGPSLAFLYLGLMLMQVVIIKLRDKGKAFQTVHDLAFPVICILLVFDSLGLLVHSLNPKDIDPALIRLDYMIFGGYPTVMLERVSFPALTDLMQLAYCSYYFLPAGLGAALLFEGRRADFERALFIIMFCFYLSYIGYLIFPALGPRYTMHHLQNTELAGLAVAGPLQELLNGLEGIKRDAFPSGHAAVALTVLHLSYKMQRRLFMLFLPAVSALVFSTVYLRYHYVVDVIGGFLLFAISILIGEKLYVCGTEGKNNRS